MMPLSDYLDIYTSYNSALWFTSPLLIAGAVVAAFLAFRKPSANTNIIVKIILAVLWIYTAAVFFGLFYGPINPSGYTMGAFFLLMAGILIADIFVKRLDFDPDHNEYLTYSGLAIIVCGIAVYPLLGLVLGRAWPQFPIFGDPGTLTIFTIGILFLTLKNSRMGYFMVPLLWSLVGGFGSGGLFHLYDGYLLALIGLIGLGVSWYYHHQQQEAMKKYAKKHYGRKKTAK